MQNRYAGDIGDFGKIGLLRALRASGLTIGVNWYLVPNETHNDDGRYVQYLKDDSFRQCDEELWIKLNQVVSGQRNVSMIQDAQLLDAVFYSDILDFSGKAKAERTAGRKMWHARALASLSGIDIVFVDPDNGLLVPSAAGTRKENKYVTPEEIADYYRQGSSVVYYQHKARVPDPVYADQHRKLIRSSDFEGASEFGLKFTKTSLRYYFFAVQPKHKAVIDDLVARIPDTAWGKLFRPLDF